jgi:flagellar protein FliS
MKINAAVDEFRQVGVNSRLTGASPHTLITMLFEGLLEKLATARGLAERGDISSRGQAISKAIAIVDSLRASLDFERGGEVSENLKSLYDYMELRLLQANTEASSELVDEISTLVQEIKAGWDAIPAQQAAGLK